MRFSVVVPVYNVEKYIGECADSLFRQSFDDFEVIFVDDGSTDASPEIVDGYAAEHSFVKAFHQENRGLSGARNTGIANSSGDYILFVDSDDYIGEDSLKAISDEIDRSVAADVIFLDSYKVFPDGKVVSMEGEENFEFVKDKPGTEVLSFIADRPKFPGSVCTKAVRKEFVIENRLYFKEGFIGEDTDWTVRAFQHAEKYSYCSHPYYYYRQKREGSITDKVGKRHVECLLETVDEYSTKNDPDETQKIVNSFMAYQTGVAILDYNSVPRAEREDLRRRIKDALWVLSYSRDRKGKILKTACKTIGIDLTSSLLSVYYKTRNKMHNG